MGILFRFSIFCVRSSLFDEILGGRSIRFCFLFCCLAFFGIDLHHIWILFGHHYLFHPIAQHHLSPLFFDQYFRDSVQDIFSVLCFRFDLLLVVSVGVDEDGPCQRKSGEFPSARSPASFLAGFAVAMPVGLFCDPDCFLSDHARASGAGHECVRESL